jgi:hypothetical protein
MSELNNTTVSLPTRKLSHTCPNGKTFTYTITAVTAGCWIIEADHTHTVRQYASWVALTNFWNALKTHLDAKYPAPSPVRFVPTRYYDPRYTTVDAAYADFQKRTGIVPTGHTMHFERIRVVGG